MTDRTDAQAAIDGLIAKQGIPSSITPTTLGTERLQVMLDSSAMRDELVKDSAIYDRSYAVGAVNGGSPVFEVSVNEQFNDSADIIKVSNTKVRLKAGYKYRIEGSLNCSCTFSQGFVNFSIYNASATAVIGLVGSIVLATNTGSNGSVVQPLAYVQAVADVDIEIQFNGGDDVTAYYAALVIQKV